jgi:hypothetical protein
MEPPRRLLQWKKPFLILPHWEQDNRHMLKEEQAQISKGQPILPCTQVSLVHNQVLYLWIIQTHQKILMRKKGKLAHRLSRKEEQHKEGNEGKESPQKSNNPPENPPLGSPHKDQSDPPEQTRNTEPTNPQDQGKDGNEKDAHTQPEPEQHNDQNPEEQGF